MISWEFGWKIATSWGLMPCSLAIISKPAASIFKTVSENKEIAPIFKHCVFSHSK
jgi:hypothetical protein